MSATPRLLECEILFGNRKLSQACGSCLFIRVSTSLALDACRFDAGFVRFLRLSDPSAAGARIDARCFAELPLAHSGGAQGNDAFFDFLAVSVLILTQLCVQPTGFVFALPIADGVGQNVDGFGDALVADAGLKHEGGRFALRAGGEAGPGAFGLRRLGG